MYIGLETRAFCSISTNDYGKNQLMIIYQRLCYSRVAKRMTTVMVGGIAPSQALCPKCLKHLSMEFRHTYSLFLALTITFPKAD